MIERFRPTTIRNVDELLPLIEDRPEFKITTQFGCAAIDYNYQHEHTFEGDPRLLECRGIKFDISTGDIIARPLHKFFNVGEHEKAEEIDLTQHHTIYDKLDGSMVHPALIDGELVFMTRAGRTEIAMQAEKMHFLPHRMRWIISNGCTPIFEYIGPENRIVLPYKESELVLLAVRNIIDGTYVSKTKTEEIARYLRFRYVKRRKVSLHDVHGMTGIEGFVIAFRDGHRLKIKTDEYVAIHRVKSDMNSKEKMVRLVLEGRADDLMATLSEVDKDEVREFVYKLLQEGEKWFNKVSVLCSFFDGDYKKFALEIVNKVQPEWLRPCLWNVVRHGVEPRETVIQMLTKYPENVETKWRDK